MKNSNSQTWLCPFLLTIGHFNIILLSILDKNFQLKQNNLLFIIIRIFKHDGWVDRQQNTVEL